MHTMFHPLLQYIPYYYSRNCNPDTCNRYNQIRNNFHLFSEHDHRLAHSNTHISTFHFLLAPTSNHLLISLHCFLHCYLMVLFLTVIQTQILFPHISSLQIRPLFPLIVLFAILLLLIFPVLTLLLEAQSPITFLPIHFQLLELIPPNRLVQSQLPVLPLFLPAVPVILQLPSLESAL